MEQIFFLIIVAVVGLVQWLSAMAEKKKNAEAEKQSAPPSPASPPSTRAPAGSEEERVRKFLEALGVPTANPPPPTVQRREVAPRVPRAKPPLLPVDPFPRPRADTGLPPPVAPVPIPPPVRAAPVVPAPAVFPTRGTVVLAARSPRLEKEQLSTSSFEVQDLDSGADAELSTGGTPHETVPPTERFAVRLANAQGLRDAIILREIFGPPRSMQPIGRVPAPAL